MNLTVSIENLGARLLSLGRLQKKVIAVLADAITCVLAMIAAFYLRLGTLPPLMPGFGIALLFAPLVSLPIFYRMGLFKAVFRHVGAKALMLITYAVMMVALPSIILFTYITINGVPRTVGLIFPVLLLVFVLLTRLIAREWFTRTEGKTHTIRRRVAIYGAGQTGRQFANALSGTHEFILSSYIDDSRELQGSTLNGLLVQSFEDAQRAIERGVITDILLAIPNAERQRRNEIIDVLRTLSVRVLTVPSVSEIARGDNLKKPHSLDIDDLLSRKPVEPQEHLLSKTITDKVVLVTGAGGSIGSELCRQIMRHRPERLVLVDQGEFALYQIDAEIEALNESKIDVVPILASVRDRRMMNEVFARYRPNTVYHASAYKHVPLVESNIIEGLANNALGTLTAAEVAREHGVETFVLVSTDKAVRPTNIMGASKRLAEMILQVMSLDRGPSRFSMVRFGNVLNSSGSVVPRFQQQIDAGGPLTITDPEITRFFMTIPEAAQLVIQAAGLAEGGEVFLLDMGEPIRILDLAKSMITLSGLRVYDEKTRTGDIAIQTVGLRPGEKLYEELLLGDDPLPTEHDLIFKANEPIFLTEQEFWSLFRGLENAITAGDRDAARTLLTELVPDYRNPESSLENTGFAPKTISAMNLEKKRQEVSK